MADLETSAVAPRRTVGYFASMMRSGLPKFYAHMFIEDLRSGILLRNVGLKGERPKEIEFSGPSDEIELAISLCASAAQGMGYSSRSVAQNAIESIALHLAWYGANLYELVDKGDRRWILASVPDRSFRRVPFAFLQHIPKTERVQSRGRAFLVLPDSHAWMVRMPRSLGGPRRYRRMLSRLESVSSLGPRFWSDDLESGKWSTEFNFGEYKHWEHAAVAKLTRKWGWDGRGLARDSETEFFHVYRGLRFRHTQAILREHIVSEINLLLGRLEINAEIRLAGYPTPEEIEELTALAISGELNYVEAYNRSS